MSGDVRAGLEIPLARSKFVLGLLGLVVMGLLGILACVLGPVTGDLFVLLVGIFLVATAVMMGSFVWRKLRARGPGLVIDGRGLTVATYVHGSQHVPWSDIAGFEASRGDRARFIHVLLQPGARLLRSHDPMLTLGPSPVTIVASNLRFDPDELEALLRRHYAMHRAPLE